MLPCGRCEALLADDERDEIGDVGIAALQEAVLGVQLHPSATLTVGPSGPRGENQARLTLRC
jgi:hypothetical protein